MLLWPFRESMYTWNNAVFCIVPIRKNLPSQRSVMLRTITKMSAAQQEALASHLDDIRRPPLLQME
jgi:hypothetical protein